MPYNSSDAIEDNLKHNTDLNLGLFKHQAELDYNFTTPDDDA